jgi:hypothetical protein
MRLPDVRPTPRGIILSIAVVALGVTALSEHTRLRELQARFDGRLDILKVLKAEADAAKRNSRLRVTFGDLGLSILRDPEKIELLRLVAARKVGIPEVTGVERTLGREFAERLGDVLLRHVDFQGYTDLPDYPSKGFRVWRRGEHLDVFYQRGGDWHLDLQAVVTDWKGVVVSDSGYWQCVSHESLGGLMDEIEGVGHRAR